MKLNNIYKVCAFAAMAVLLPSCSDSFLDHQPDERTEIKTVDDVQKLLITSYPAGNYSWVAEISGDNFIDNQSKHLPSDPTAKPVLSYYNYASYDRQDEELFRFEPAKSATSTSYDSPGGMWGDYYSTIACTNFALSALDKVKAENGGVESEKAKALRAEALLLRSYCHFCLVTVFSQMWKDEEQSKKDIGVPYVTEVESTVTKEYPRGTVYDDYMAIKKDLEEALPIVSDTYITTGSKYHFNVNAAHAFAARFYLYTRDWDKVIEHANFVLGTDSVSADRMMLDYEAFDDCAGVGDYAKVWQNPSQNNNLFLTVTGSLLQRRCFGARYSLAGEPCRAAMMLTGEMPDLWGGYILPIQSIVNGSAFSSSTKDYGFFSAKIGEEFQYTNKLAGIGMPKIIHRAFTASELLLSRAEAKVMKGEYEEGMKDVCIYWNSSYGHFSSRTKEQMAGFWVSLTPEMLYQHYNNSTKYNCFANWDFTQEVSPEFVIPAAATPYMNCINEMRRFETVFEGLRFFDLKRWGIPYKHTVGVEGVEYEIKAGDPRLAVEVPWETLAAGIESSRPTFTVSKMDAKVNREALRLPVE